jgi:hypothetical protein
MLFCYSSNNMSMLTQSIATETFFSEVATEDQRRDRSQILPKVSLDTFLNSFFQ